MTTAADVLHEINDRSTRQQHAGSFGPVALLVDNKTLFRLVATWPNVPPSKAPRGSTVCPAELDASARLRWYWSLLEPDPIAEWLRVAGLPDAPHTRRSCNLAIENYLVRPDGGISVWAEQFVLSKIRAAT